MIRITMCLALILLIGCKNDSNFSTSNEQSVQSVEKSIARDKAPTYEEEAPSPESMPQSTPITKPAKSKIIKTGNLDFEVAELSKSKEEVDALVLKYDSYFENEQYSSYSNRINYHLLIRIPNSKFDTLVKELENSIGKLTSKNINAKNVSEEYVDLNIRLENKQAYLRQYKEILTKAKTIKEILEVREIIRRIEAEIESKKGRLKFLDDQVRYSTLRVELTEKVNVVVAKAPTFGSRLIKGFKNGAQGILSFIILLANIWPFVILLFLILLLRRRVSTLF